MFPETRQPDALTKPSVLLPVERDVERELDSGEASLSDTGNDVVATSIARDESVHADKFGNLDRSQTAMAYEIESDFQASYNKLVNMASEGGPVMMGAQAFSELLIKTQADIYLYGLNDMMQESPIMTHDVRLDYILSISPWDELLRLERQRGEVNERILLNDGRNC